jgi:hypothetical protein
MKRLTTGIAIMLIVAYGMLSAGTAHAKKGKKDKVSTYEVTITNITRGQIISPPIVISHKKDFQLFSLGNPASAGLALLAEQGDPTMLVTELSVIDSVFKYESAAGGIGPGASMTVEIETKKDFRFLSAAGMLVSTNDAFFAVQGVEVRKKDGMIVEARAYDAGSELNSELCEFVPGPTTTAPCPSPEVGHDPSDSEGYIYIHSGIHGIADLDPTDYDWLNPVAIITIQKVK